MTPFRVWAPHAQRIELEIAGKRHPMTATDYGWWHAELGSDENRADYAFVLDGG
jgi:maltooligosyltrehalose trehalohydrolase